MSAHGDHHRDSYGDHLERMARQLEETAARIRREGQPRDTASMTGVPRHIYAANQVVNALDWDRANLNVESLLNQAALADVVELRELTGEAGQ